MAAMKRKVNISASKLTRHTRMMTVVVTIPPTVIARTVMRIKAMSAILWLGTQVMRLGCAVGGVGFTPVQGREAGESSEADPPARVNSHPALRVGPRRWGRIGTLRG